MADLAKCAELVSIIIIRDEEQRQKSVAYSLYMHGTSSRDIRRAIELGHHGRYKS
jgi:hypothetical protein